MSLRILTWNISYGYGPGSEGDEGYHPKSKTHFRSTLDSIGEVIRQLNADIVLLQEVDFFSRRSHFQNQLEYLSRRSDHLYRHAFVTWNHPYVPYPGLSPVRHFGPIRSGGGILSRAPIHPLQLDLLAKPRENSRLWNFFYLHRYLQIVEIGGTRICNLHLEAFSKENRELHLVRLQDRLVEYDLEITGGDFNGSIKIRNEIAERWISAPAPSPTFPSTNPETSLDGFLVKKNRFGGHKVTTIDTGVISDHLPVLLELEDESRSAI